MRFSSLTIIIIALAALMLACESGGSDSKPASSGGSGGGTGGGGGSGTVDWESALDDLALRGGGMKGELLASGDAFWVRAIDAESHQPLSGVGVSVANEQGVVLSSSTTDAMGQASFEALSELPASVTFVDPASSNLFSFASNSVHPLRQFLVAAFEQAPTLAADLDLTITNLPAGEDLVVRLNGVEVHTADDCSASESFTVDASALGAGVLEANAPWLVIAEVFDNSGAGVNRDDLLSASYLADSTGTDALATSVAISLNHATGSATGATGGGLGSGLCTIGTVSGNIQRPLTLLGTLALPRISLGIINAFGTWNYDQITFDVSNPLSLLNASFPYSFEYPIVPPALIGGSWGSSARQVQVFLADAATLTPIFQGGGLPDNFDPATLTNIALLVRQFDQAGVSNADINMQGTAALATATAYTDFSVDTLAGVAQANVTAVMVGEVDANNWFVTLATGSDGELDFRVPSASIGSFATARTWLALSNAGADGMGDATGQALLRAPWVSQLALSGNGDTGSAAARESVDGQLSTSGSVTLERTAPLAGAAFDLDMDAIQWQALGLEDRDGIHQLNLVIDPAGAARSWQIVLASGSMQSVGSGTYSLMLPQLPSGAPFDAAAINSSVSELSIALTYLDLGDVAASAADFGFDEVRFDFALSADLLTSNVLSIFNSTPRLWQVSVAGAATVDPE